MLPQRSPAFILTSSGTASCSTPSITRRSSCRGEVAEGRWQGQDISLNCGHA